VAFHVADSADIGPGPFDVVVFSDSLHDMGDPPGALARAREVLVDGGIVVVVEPWSVDGLTDRIGNPSIRMDNAISTSVCTPTALAQHGNHAIGTQGGPSLRLKLLADAGFRGRPRGRALGGRQQYRRPARAGRRPGTGCDRVPVRPRRRAPPHRYGAAVGLGAARGHGRSAAAGTRAGTPLGVLARGAPVRFQT
jgi:hypothetical protein